MQWLSVRPLASLLLCSPRPHSCGGVSYCPTSWLVSRAALRVHHRRGPSSLLTPRGPPTPSPLQHKRCHLSSLAGAILVFKYFEHFRGTRLWLSCSTWSSSSLWEPPLDSVQPLLWLFPSYRWSLLPTPVFWYQPASSCA